MSTKQNVVNDLCPTWGPLSTNTRYFMYHTFTLY